MTKADKTGLVDLDFMAFEVERLLTSGYDRLRAYKKQWDAQREPGTPRQPPTPTQDKR